MKQSSEPDLAGVHGVEAQLHAYHSLVRRYHRTLDLVSDRALGQFPALIAQARMYADAIEGASPPGSVLDVGSGVGLPGIVVAVALPHRSVLLVERRRRRATFLRLVVSQLGLSNARVSESDVRDVSLAVLASFEPQGSVPPDVEALGGEPLGFAVVTAQAVAPLADIYCLTRHLHAGSVTLVARKGPSWHAEVRAIEDRIGSAAAVRAKRPLPDSGTLVAIDVPGGLPCPPSG